MWPIKALDTTYWLMIRSGCVVMTILDSLVIIGDTAEWQRNWIVPFYRLRETWEDTICQCADQICSPHNNVHLTSVWFLHYKLASSSILLWHFLAEPPEVFCVMMGWVGGGWSSHPLTLLYEGSVRGQVVLAGGEGGGWARGEGRLRWVGGEPSCCLVLLRFQPEWHEKLDEENVAHNILSQPTVLKAFQRCRIL